MSISITYCEIEITLLFSFSISDRESRKAQLMSILGIFRFRGSAVFDKVTMDIASVSVGLTADGGGGGWMTEDDRIGEV